MPDDGSTEARRVPTSEEMELGIDRLRHGGVLVVSRRNRMFSDGWLISSVGDPAGLATVCERGTGPLAIVRPADDWTPSVPADVCLHLESLEPFANETLPRSVAEVGGAIERLLADSAQPHPAWLRPVIPHPGGVVAHRTPIEAAHTLVREAGRRGGALLRRLSHLGADDLYQTDLFRLCEWFERRAQPRLIAAPIATRLPTPYGTFEVRLFEDPWTRAQQVAMVFGDVTGPAPVLVRMHSECLTGDIMGSLRCDCGSQLSHGLARIAASKRGVLLYLRQEGRGIGLFHKLRAYVAQDAGLDTVDANETLGFPPDLRTYAEAAQMLRLLGVQSVQLLTNNPAKIEALAYHGIQIASREQLVVGRNIENLGYLETKRARMGHMLEPNTESTPTNRAEQGLNASTRRGTISP
jgi:GTP cyclohydrolase II